MPSVRAKSQIRLPGPSNRTTVIGRTGSGKSHFAAWLLSTQNFDSMPWVIIDFKDEDTDIINNIDGVIYIDDWSIPRAPGIYMIKPTLEDMESLSQWFRDVLRNGHVGVFIDELFPIGQHDKAFNNLMLQGRSKKTPVICCTQRPANVSTYAFSEASFFIVFDVTKISDRRKIHEEISFIPTNYSLPEYHSYYYDVAKKYDDKLGPAPSEREILAKIQAKMPPPPRRTL